MTHIAFVSRRVSYAREKRCAVIQGTVTTCCMLRTHAIAIAVLLAAGSLPALAQIAVRNQGFVPFSDPPINYRTDPVDDPIARLQKRVSSGEVAPSFITGHQTQMHKLITVTNYRTRLALHAGLGTIAADAKRQYEEPAEELIRYLAGDETGPAFGVEGRRRHEVRSPRR